jgi:hypothetical protein
MKGGWWVPITKGLQTELPKDRPFTKLEAMYSLSLDYDDGKEATIKGYSVLWKWGQGRVNRFLKEIGAKISYPKDTKKHQNQRGEIVILKTERSGRKRGQIKMIDSKDLRTRTERSCNANGEMPEGTQGTTVDPEPKPKNKEPVLVVLNGEKHTLPEFFDKLWKVYPNKVGKQFALKVFQSSVKSQKDADSINAALGNYLTLLDIEAWRKPQDGSRWFNNWRNWITEDEHYDGA